MSQIPQEESAAGARGPGSLVVLVVGLVLGAVAFASVGSFMVYANSEQFCANACHEMQPLQKEHKGTIHDVNRSGVRATCNDCHVPHEYVPNYLAKLGCCPTSGATGPARSTPRRSSRPSATSSPSGCGCT